MIFFAKPVLLVFSAPGKHLFSKNTVAEQGFPDKQKGSLTQQHKITVLFE